ncbi:hypothetical protein GGQ74_000950 [Desulfobaculum xiamenense]|uniref:Uncharacterized protein n=1 Tax=Desulfobaculum xiamenense TaxID=995050 RepID=A0A846QJR7_9BACT|nr:hypothetical protein [Desulfobaculum xiamenense]NJB67310.1 hypothetical protein [Desulfobaculum xiamenense]
MTSPSDAGPNLAELCGIAGNAHRRHMKLFVRHVAQRLAHAGLSAPDIEQALHAALEDYLKDSDFERECRITATRHTNERLAQENRGRDGMGRLIVEYAFIRAEGGPLVHPEDSEQDSLAREALVTGVLPRPVMRYFLISVRGTVRGIDGFESDSLLFGKDCASYRLGCATLETILVEFRSTGRDGRSSVDWSTIYDDRRVRRLGHEFIREIADTLTTLGEEHYQRILENIRQRDPERTATNHMTRTIARADVELIMSALRSALDRHTE